MKPEVVFTEHAAQAGREHLLRHYLDGQEQEELCFALWRQSTGVGRKTAIIYDILKPRSRERNLHGNASFEPHYLSRAVREARSKNAGLAFLHSHPGSGWQDMSRDDIVAERDVISYPAQVTKHPLVGLTIGRDGYWSARWWERAGREFGFSWCRKVRVVGSKKLEIYLRPDADRRKDWAGRLRRTQDSWGPAFQRTIENLRVGIVGLGSVGSITAEAFARIGVGTFTLIDGDRVEEHNLDRLLYATVDDVGKAKVDLAADTIERHATHAGVIVERVKQEIQNETAYREALDCDIIMSCVDRPVGRDVLNYVAQAHLVPVIDAGVAVEAFVRPRKFFSAHWRTHVVTPEHQCLRCAGQYSSGDVVAELDGSLGNPAYIKGLEEAGIQQNMNTFPFALGAASLQTNLALRYLLGAAWWPPVSRQEYQFTKGVVTRESRQCERACSFLDIAAAGDAKGPPYLRRGEPPKGPRSRWTSWVEACKEFWSKLR